MWSAVGGLGIDRAITTCIISFLSYLSSRLNITYGIILTLLLAVLSCLGFGNLSGYVPFFTDATERISADFIVVVTVVHTHGTISHHALSISHPQPAWHTWCICTKSENWKYPHCSFKTCQLRSTTNILSISSIAISRIWIVSIDFHRLIKAIDNNRLIIID